MQVIDVSVANKICNGKFYFDNKKLIKVSIFCYFCSYSMLVLLKMHFDISKQLELFNKEKITGFFWLATATTGLFGTWYYAFKQVIMISYS